MTDITKVTFVCVECGSDDVDSEAWATWDVDEQKWVVKNTEDETFCQKCESERRLDMKDVATGKIVDICMGCLELVFADSLNARRICAECQQHDPRPSWERKKAQEDRP